MVEFKHLGTGIVYLMCIYKEGKLVPFSVPVLLRDSVTTVYLKPDFTNRQNVILTRKCKVSIQMLGFAELMVGSLFQGSNTIQFGHPENLYQITDVPDFLEEKDALPDKKFRYVRYFSPHKEIHAAEIQFLGKNEHGETVLLQGKPIWNFGSDSISNPEPVNALYGDIRTNFDAPCRFLGRI